MGDIGAECILSNVGRVAGGDWFLSGTIIGSRLRPLEEVSVGKSGDVDFALSTF